MPKYKVGDEVTCINVEPLVDRLTKVKNEYAPALLLEADYTVQSIVLDAQGNQHLNVGLVSQIGFVRSWETGDKLPDGDKIHWCHPSRFVPKS